MRVSPIADPEIFTLLNDRGYQPFEFTSVLYRPIQRNVRFAELRNDQIQVRRIEADEIEMWAQTSARGLERVSGAG